MSAEALPPPLSITWGVLDTLGLDFRFGSGGIRAALRRRIPPEPNDTHLDGVAQAPLILLD